MVITDSTQRRSLVLLPSCDRPLFMCCFHESWCLRVGRRLMHLGHFSLLSVARAVESSYANCEQKHHAIILNTAMLRTPTAALRCAYYCQEHVQWFGHPAVSMSSVPLIFDLVCTYIGLIIVWFGRLDIAHRRRVNFKVLRQMLAHVLNSVE